VPIPPRRNMTAHMYYRIAQRHTQRISEVERELIKIYPYAGAIGASTYEYFEDLLREHEASIPITIVFSAMALEAFIYDYAISSKAISKSFMDVYLDKLTPQAKYLIIPKLVTGKQFPEQSKAFSMLKKLFSTRNTLIHSKSSPEPLLIIRTERSNDDDQEENEEQFYEMNGKEIAVQAAHLNYSVCMSALEVIQLVMQELDNIDITKPSKQMFANY
jgi:hypothetical protein